MTMFDADSAIWPWIIRLPPLVLAITVHEVAHGLTAKRLGDPTAAEAGRLSLNPIRHIDPIGTLVVPILLYLFSPFMFGWARPVPVNFNRLNHPRRDMIWVAAAGPGSNFAMAAIWSGIILVSIKSLPIPGLTGELIVRLIEMARFGVVVNVFLALFNLFPIPPLDGGRVLAGLLPPPAAAVLSRIEPFGIVIVLGIFFLDHYTSLDVIVPYLLIPATNIIEFFLTHVGLSYP